MTAIYDEHVDTQRGAVPPFPADPFPTGWFQVAWADELLPGDVQRLHYFGSDIVLWRTGSGEIRALDAYCLHLGANLAVGGRVDGEELVCPWHGWHWDGKGRNTHIPFSEVRCRPHLCIRSYPVREWNGCVLLWFDRADRPPHWEPPVISELEDRPFHAFDVDTRERWEIKAHIQNVAENTGDLVHVIFVHGAGVLPEVTASEFKDHCWSATFSYPFGAGRETTWLTPDGPVDVTWTGQFWGLGLASAVWLDKPMPAVMLNNATPVDDTHLAIWFSMTTERQSAGEAAPNGAQRKLIEYQKRQVQADFAPWENMKMPARPNFTPEEVRSWRAFRHWAAQFYVSGDELA